MPKFIIIGYYDDNGQSYADERDADDAFEAFRLLVRDLKEENEDGDLGDLVLVQAVRLPDGECTSPCDNNGDTCFANDYPTGE